MMRTVFTCGDVNGIGLEVVVKSLQKMYEKRDKDQSIVIAPLNAFLKNYNDNDCNFPYKLDSKTEIAKSSEPVIVYPIKEIKITPGIPTKQSGKISFISLKESFSLLEKNIVDAVVTAPVSKYALKLAGINFPGQTEMFAEWCNVKNFMMTFLSSKMNAGLLTIHIPLSQVSDKINLQAVRKGIELLIRTIKVDLGIIKPKIAVLGLNPHAGEDGIIGREEVLFINPAVGLNEYKDMVDGPFPADAFFGMRKYEHYNFILGMYHDQVLTPFKLLNFDKGVNYTAGLPIVRTSPDHGCAFDIAGKRKADELSLYTAYLYAKKIVKNRKKNKSI